MTVIKGKLFVSFYVSIPFIVEGAGEFISLLIHKLSGPLSVYIAIDDYYGCQIYKHQIYLPLGTQMESQDNIHRH